MYVNLASVALAENKLDEAISFYNSALGIDGSNFNSLRGLIAIYASQNHIDQAHARIDQALAAQAGDRHVIRSGARGHVRIDVRGVARLVRSGARSFQAFLRSARRDLPGAHGFLE